MRKYYNSRHAAFVCVLAALVAATLLLGFPRGLRAEETGADEQPMAWVKLLGFEGDRFAFSALGVLGNTYDGRADVAECLETLNRIKNNDTLSWYEEWFKTAERVFNAAEESRKKGHTISAGEAYLRASSYYLTSEFFMHEDPDDPRALGAARKSVDCFQNAMKLLPIPVEIVSIPYEGTMLPAYFYTSPHAGESAPLLICQTGFDGNVESMYGTAMAAIKRGYHCLAFEGPGQGRVLREQTLTFRHDWEKVITPVVDYALTRPEVDPDRIAVLGWSFGGYLVPRAACYEHRPKVYIANGGIYSFYESVTGMIPPELLGLLETDPDAFNAEAAKLAEQSPMMRWGQDDSKWKFGADSVADAMAKMQKYTLEGQLHQIKSHIVVVDSETDVIIQQSQAKKLYDALTCPKTWMLFTAEEAADAHCQAGAHAVSYQRMFDWLDEFFAEPAK